MKKLFIVNILRAVLVECSCSNEKRTVSNLHMTLLRYWSISIIFVPVRQNFKFRLSVFHFAESPSSICTVSTTQVGVIDNCIMSSSVRIIT